MTSSQTNGVKRSSQSHTSPSSKPASTNRRESNGDRSPKRCSDARCDWSDGVDKPFSHLLDTSDPCVAKHRFPNDVPASSFPTFLQDAARLLTSADHYEVIDLFDRAQKTIQT